MNNSPDLMTRAIAACWQSQRVSSSSDDWAGVVVRFEGWRVIISRNACDYRCQEWVSTHGRWGPARGASSPFAWAETFSASHPQFAGRLLALPRDARDAAASLAIAQGIDLPSAYRVRYWSAPDYSGVISTDENLRSVVDRAGRVYAIQWRLPDPPAGEPVSWITQAKGSFWPDLVNFMSGKTHSVDDLGEPVDLQALTSRLCDLFDGSPFEAQDGPLPVGSAPFWLSSSSPSPLGLA